MISIRRNPLISIGVFGLLVITSVLVATTASHRNRIAQQHDHIAVLQGQIASTEREVAGLQQATVDAQLGYSGGRVTRDERSIFTLLNHTFNWSNTEEYVANRESLQRLYGFRDNSRYLLTFLPEPPVNKDQHGNEYSYIDAAGLNSSLGSVKPRLLSVKGLEYSYLVLADVVSRSADGRNTRSTATTIFVTVDAEGKVVTVTGYTSGKDARRSN